MTSGDKTTIESDEVRINPAHGLWTLINRDLKGWYKSPTFLVVTLVQPIVWLALYGKTISYKAIFTGSGGILNLPKQVIDSYANQLLQSAFGTSDYFSFLTAGMLAFIVLFGASFSGISIVFERRFGFLGKALTTPVSRSVIVMSKVLSSVVKSLAQAAIVLIVGMLLGMQLTNVTLLGLAGTFAGLVLLALGLSSIFMMSALRSANWQLQLALMNFISLPLLFASNALFPIKFMPTWMQYVASLNPMTYATDVARQLLIGSTGIVSLQLDFAYLGAFALLFSAVSAVLSWKYLTKG